jgi:hypothetical protein
LNSSDRPATMTQAKKMERVPVMKYSNTMIAINSHFKKELMRVAIV